MEYHNAAHKSAIWTYQFLPIFQIADLTVLGIIWYLQIGDLKDRYVQIADLIVLSKILYLQNTSCLLSKDASAGVLPTNHPDAKMYTLVVVNAEKHGQPVAHAVLANFIVLVLFNFKKYFKYD